MERREIPAGLLGEYYAARHAHGHYRSCAVTGRYQFSSLTIKNNVELTTLLKYALAQVIRRHPVLNYGLVEKTKEKDAHFVRLRTIEWDDVVEFQTSRALDVEEQDDVLARAIGKGHEYHFSDQDRKPAWKVVVVHHEGIPSRERGVFDVVFLGHHAIADGKSGVAFHKTLFLQLSQGETSHPSQSAWPIIVPEDTPKPSFIEDAFPFPPNSKASKQEEVGSPSTAPEIWASIPPTKKDYSSHVKFITVPQTELKTTLQTCRRLNITVTGLLHALILTYLSKTIPEAKAFRAVTPYSMRPFTKASEGAMVNHISFILTEWTEEIITSIRACSSEDDEKETYKRIATRLSTQLKAELERIPTHGSPPLLDIAKITDFDAFCEESMRKSRSTSFELSNVGVVSLGSKNPLRGDGIFLEKLFFTQCGMVCGPALGCSAVSLAGGPMVVSMHWQGGVLEESFVDGLKVFLERQLKGMGDE